MFGCLGDVDSDLLLKRYVPGEAPPVKLTPPTAKVVVHLPSGTKKNGTYVDRVRSDVGLSWFKYMSDGRNRYKTGSTTVSFAITAGGEIKDVQVVKNTSNEEFAKMCQKVVEETKIPPPSEETIKEMKNGELNLTFTFNYLPSPQPPMASPHP
jgi:TonB family protein